MIKHIFELDRQAQEYAAMELATVNTGGVAEFNRLYRNKFAELIVQECISIVQKRYMGDNNREDMEVLRCVADMKQHFGVEE